MTESGEGLHSPAFGVNRNRETRQGGLGCVANTGVISGHFGSVAMLGLSSCFFGSVARKELRRFFGLERASGASKDRSATRQTRGKLAAVARATRTPWRTST